MAKDKTPKKKKGAASAAPSEWPLISVAQHPRATRSIRRSKAWAGLLALALVGLLSWRAGVPPFEVGVRALLAGIALYLVVWAAGVALWQRIVVQEAKAEAERRRDERAAQIAALHARHAAQNGEAGDGEAAIA